MKTFKTELAFQGDVAFLRVAELPKDGISKSKNGTVAHSETGHNHVLDDLDVATLYEVDDEPLNAYIDVQAGEEVDLVHQRSYQPHETIRFDEGIYKVFRQREYTPEGFRRVAD